jgi:hypothetical protein
MSARAYAWCAVLAAASDDVLGAVLADVIAAHPEVTAVAHRRERLAEGAGECWWLRVVLVPAAGATPSGLDRAERAIATAADRWTHSFPVFERVKAIDPRQYHTGRARGPLPPPPAPRIAPPAPVAPRPVAAPAAASVAPAAQRGLFA